MVTRKGLTKQNSWKNLTYNATPHCVLLSEGRYDELVKEVKSLKTSGKCSMNVTWLRAHYDVVTVSSCILQDPVINNIYKLQYEPFPSSGTRS